MNKRRNVKSSYLRRSQRRRTVTLPKDQVLQLHLFLLLVIFTPAFCLPLLLPLTAAAAAAAPPHPPGHVHHLCPSVLFCCSSSWSSPHVSWLTYLRTNKHSPMTPSVSPLSLCPRSELSLHNNWVHSTHFYFYCHLLVTDRNYSSAVYHHFAHSMKLTSVKDFLQNQSPRRIFLTLSSRGFNSCWFPAATITILYYSVWDSKKKLKKIKKVLMAKVGVLYFFR